MLLGKLSTIFKDYYWDFRVWSQNLPIDTHISSVKKLLPHYVTIDWENPEILGNGLLFPITKIKGHTKDKSTHFLGFVNDLYSGYVFRK